MSVGLPAYKGRTDILLYEGSTTPVKIRGWSFYISQGPILPVYMWDRRFPCISSRPLISIYKRRVGLPVEVTDRLPVNTWDRLPVYIADVSAVLGRDRLTPVLGRHLSLYKEPLDPFTCATSPYEPDAAIIRIIRSAL